MDAVDENIIDGNNSNCILIHAKLLWFLSCNQPVFLISEYFDLL